MKKDISIEKAHRANKINLEKILKNKDSYQSFVLDEKTKKNLCAIPQKHPIKRELNNKNTYETVKKKNIFLEKIQAFFSLQSFSWIPRYAVYSLTLFLLVGIWGLFYMQQQKQWENFAYQADSPDEEMVMLANSYSYSENDEIYENDENYDQKNAFSMDEALPENKMMGKRMQASPMAMQYSEPLAKTIAIENEAEEKEESIWGRIKNFFLVIKNKVKNIFS